MKNLLNLFKKPKIKMILILTILLFAYTTVCAISYAQNISTDIANSVFRLHVIANSDSTEDQNLKYKVRDNLLSYMNELCKNCSSKQESINIAKQHENDFKEIALNTIHDNGYSYDVNVKIAHTNKNVGIEGEYLIKTLEIPLGVGNNMTITAIKVYPKEPEIETIITEYPYTGQWYSSTQGQFPYLP